MANKKPLLVAIDDSSASLEALELATTIAKAQKVPVYAVHVIEVLRSLPVNAEMEWEARQGENLLRRAEERVPVKDVAFNSELLQSRQAGQAIVEEAISRQATAIVLGLSHRRVYGDYELGATAAYVLKHAQCQVLVVREPEREGNGTG